MRGQIDFSKYQCALCPEVADGYMRSKTAAYYLCKQHFTELYDRYFKLPLPAGAGRYIAAARRSR